MELKTQQLKQNTIKSKAFTQVTLDDDCIVRDSKPDIIKIILTKVKVAFEETKISIRRCGLPENSPLPCFTGAMRPAIS